MSANLYTEHMERMVEGYARFSVDVPSARDFVWERVNDLANGQLAPMERTDQDIRAAFAALYHDLPDRVAARTKEIKNASR